jgi:hypothetical protein
MEDIVFRLIKCLVVSVLILGLLAWGLYRVYQLGLSEFAFGILGALLLVFWIEEYRPYPFPAKVRVYRQQLKG